MKETEPCAYCGKNSGVERDHVIPRGLFPEPRPDNLITVPSCPACNRGFSKDEEYFRVMLLSIYGVTERNAAATSVFNGPVVRSLRRETSTGLLASVKDSLRDITYHSEDGALVARLPGVEIDRKRFDRVVGKTVRGLFYYHSGCRLPDGFDVLVSLGPDLELDSPVMQRLRNLTPSQYGEVFRYTWVKAEDRSEATCWLMEYYGVVPVLAATYPSDKAERIRAQATEDPLPWMPPI